MSLYQICRVLCLLDVEENGAFVVKDHQVLDLTISDTTDTDRSQSVETNPEQATEQ